MNKEFYKELVAYNTPEFQYAKLAEELNELAMICLKRINKKSDHHPKMSEFIEELGDVRLRMNALIEQEGIHEEVKERVLAKAIKLIKWKSEDKYKGGL